MPTLLIKNVSRDLLEKLNKLKIKFRCRSWAELLEILVNYGPREVVSLSHEDLKGMEEGIKEFMVLREVVSRKWVGEPSVVEEFRRMREHGED